MKINDRQNDGTHMVDSLKKELKVSENQEIREMESRSREHVKFLEHKQ